MTVGGSRRRRESLTRLFAPVAVPRHLCDMEARGASIADGLHGEHWNGVGWIEDGPVVDPLAAVDDA